MAIAFVIKAFAQGTSAGATTGAVDTTGANLLVLAVAYNPAVSAPTISDSKSNTWTPLTAQATVSGSGQAIRILYISSPTVGSGHTFSVAGTSSLGSIAMLAFSGVRTSSPFDQESGTATITGAFVVTSLQPGSVTPAGSGEVFVAGISTGSTSSLPSIDSGYTITDEALQVGGASFGLAAAYLVNSGASASNPTWSWVSNNNGATVLAAFKAPAAAATNVQQTLIINS